MDSEKLPRKASRAAWALIIGGVIALVRLSSRQPESTPPAPEPARTQRNEVAHHLEVQRARTVVAHEDRQRRGRRPVRVAPEARLPVAKVSPGKDPLPRALDAALPEWGALELSWQSDLTPSLALARLCRFRDARALAQLKERVLSSGHTDGWDRLLCHNPDCDALAEKARTAAPRLWRTFLIEQLAQCGRPKDAQLVDAADTPHPAWQDWWARARPGVFSPRLLENLQQMTADDSFELAALALVLSDAQRDARTIPAITRALDRLPDDESRARFLAALNGIDDPGLRQRRLEACRSRQPPCEPAKPEPVRAVSVADLVKAGVLPASAGGVAKDPLVALEAAHRLYTSWGYEDDPSVTAAELSVLDGSPLRGAIFATGHGLDEPDFDTMEAWFEGTSYRGPRPQTRLQVVAFLNGISAARGSSYRWAVVSDDVADTGPNAIVDVLGGPEAALRQLISEGKLPLTKAP